jgi:hypothetical protein
MARTYTDVPACPNCGATTWQCRIPFDGSFTWLIDAAGWHDEEHDSYDDQGVDWTIACDGCWREWSSEDRADDDIGQKLWEALDQIFQKQSEAKRAAARRRAAAKKRRALSDPAGQSQPGN